MRKSLHYKIKMSQKALPTWQTDINSPDQYAEGKQIAFKKLYRAKHPHCPGFIVKLQNVFEDGTRGAIQDVKLKHTAKWLDEAGNPRPNLVRVKEPEDFVGQFTRLIKRDVAIIYLALLARIAQEAKAIERLQAARERKLFIAMAGAQLKPSKLVVNGYNIAVVPPEAVTECQH